MKTLKYLLVALLTWHSLPAAATSFETDGEGIRNAVSARVGGKDVIYISEMDGAVALYNLDGEKMWSNSTGTKAIAFRIVAKDITADGNDDLILASGDGNLYAWSSNGELLWRYNPGVKVRLNEVAVMGSGAGAKIFAAGNSMILYEVDSRGVELSRTPIDGVVRVLAVGNFIDKQRESIFIHTLQHDKYRSKFFGFIDPTTKEVIRKSSFNAVYKEADGNGLMVTDYKVVDINEDGKADILYGGNKGGGVAFAFDGEFNVIFKYANLPGDTQRYAHTTVATIQPLRNEVVMQYGGVMYIINTKNRLVAKSGAPHRGVIYNDLLYCSESRKLYGAGQVGGDNSLYCYDIMNPLWFNTEHQFMGRAKEVNDNINTLYQQSLEFKRPDYQPQSDKGYVVTVSTKTVATNGDDMISECRLPNVEFLNEEVKALDGGKLDMVTQYIISEDYDRSQYEFMGTSADRRDRRKKYGLTHEQIVHWAQTQEQNGACFAIWAGHGGDPLYMDTKTLERIIEVAPTTCKSLIYAEMGNTSDPRNIFFVNEVVPRVAAVIKRLNTSTKIQFRYKGKFWADEAHFDLWRKLFFSKKYSNILVPSAEDTNNRVQEINLSGRVGMFLSEYVDDYSIRLVDDNPTSWRPYSPGGQRSVSPYLRNAVLMAGYGARYGLFYDINYFEEPGFNAFYALVKSGVIPVVEREDILSIGSWLAFKNIEEPHDTEGSGGGHDIMRYKESDNDRVVANNGVHWCGAPIHDYDYSKMLGVEYRWLNFIPTLPYGMIPVTDLDSERDLKAIKADYVISDLKKGFVKGKEVEAAQFGEYMRESVERGAKRMMLRVEGVSWSLIKIDDNHARLILIDPGYVNPSQREAKIVFQAESPILGVDILSGERFDTSKSKELTVSIPAGSMRFIDLKYKTPIERLRSK